MTREPVKLGTRCRDRVTGFAGVVTGRAEYLYDTPSVRLTAETKQGDQAERWVTEARVEPYENDKHAGFGP